MVGGLSYLVYPDRHWVNPFADGTPAEPSGALNLSWINTAGNYLALDARTNFFTNYYSISPGMLSYTPSKGTNYMMGFTDSDGAPLSGGSKPATVSRLNASRRPSTVSDHRQVGL